MGICYICGLDCQRSGRYVADTDAPESADTRVAVVVYCSFHNLNRGFIVFI